MKVKDKEIAELMAEVQTQLATVLKSEQEKLAKALPGEETSSEVPADDSATADAPDASPAPEASADVPPAPEAPPADAPADAPPADPAMDPAANEMDPEAIKAELAQMPIEHVKALFLAAKEVMMAAMGGDPEAPAAPAPEAAPEATPAPAPDAPPALKSEMGESVTKSEKDIEIETLKKRVSDFEGLTSGLLSVVETAIKVPARKAVASVTELAKSGPDASQLAKSEINARLKRAAETRLAKSDRELINQYTVGKIGVEGIKHLLEIK